jgi:tRNA (cytidine/uridine-2'-O-)-methyltransferase
MQKETEMQCNELSIEVVLFEPEIPQNTGNIARTCAVLGCSLHLIEPLGFSLEDKYLRRAGLDYWHSVQVSCYPDLDAFFTNRNGRFIFLTKKSQQNFYEADLRCNMPLYFFFGKETMGLPAYLLSRHTDDCYRIPMRQTARSLNLSNAAAIVLYEAYRHNDFPGLQ